MSTAEPVRSLHESAVVVDSHNDLLGLVARRPRAEQATYFRSRWLPQLRAGRIDLQVLAVYSASDDLRQINLTVEAAHRVAEANSDAVVLCETGADIDRALSASKIALVIALEGCGALGTSVEMLDVLFRLGVRMVSFTHMGRTAFADGSGEDAAVSRLTAAGVEALALVEELGMLMDVSHLSAGCVDDVLARATRPVVASHSSAFALCQHHRNLTDDRLRGIAASGGVIGVNFLARYVDAVDPSVERLVDQIVYIASTAGIAHIGLGPDFIGEYAAEIEPQLCEQVTPHLEGPKSLPLITEHLLARGTPESDVRAVLGSNWLRVLRAEMGVSASARTAAGRPLAVSP
jgi:membrane dipeptidase